MNSYFLFNNSMIYRYENRFVTKQRLLAYILPIFCLPAEAMFKAIVRIVTVNDYSIDEEVQHMFRNMMMKNMFFLINNINNGSIKIIITIVIIITN